MGDGSPFSISSTIKIAFLCVKSNNLSFGLNRISIFFSGSPVVLILKRHYKYFVVSVIASCMVAVDNGDIFEQYAKTTQF